jgi:hypothetical protein
MGLSNGFTFLGRWEGQRGTCKKKSRGWEICLPSERQRCTAVKLPTAAAAKSSTLILLFQSVNSNDLPGDRPHLDGLQRQHSIVIVVVESL